MSFPAKIICLTEETVETLYLLGKEHLIAGVSEYVQRPSEAIGKFPVVAQFLKADYDQILALKADLVMGYSDVQTKIAAELTSRGQNIYISHQHSLEEIFHQILFLGRLVGASDKAQDLVRSFNQIIEKTRQENAGQRKLKLYFEEWDHPMYSCSRWISELIEICGGENIFAHKIGRKASEREVCVEEVVAANPDVILACWCGKKVELDKIVKRQEFDQITAVKFNQVYEVDPTVFLQPGPALFLEALPQLVEIFRKARSQS